MFKKQEKEPIEKESAIFTLYPSDTIPNAYDGCTGDVMFGGFPTPTQVVFHINDMPYYYHVQVGQTIYIREYCSLPSPTKYLVKEMSPADNKIILERIAELDFTKK